MHYGRMTGSDSSNLNINHLFTGNQFFLRNEGNDDKINDRKGEYRVYATRFPLGKSAGNNKY